MKVDGGTGVHECAGIRLEMLGDPGIIVALFCLQVTSFLTAGTGTCVAGVSIHSISGLPVSGTVAGVSCCFPFCACRSDKY